MKKSKIFAFALSCVLIFPCFTTINSLDTKFSVNAEEVINYVPIDEYNYQVDTMISLVNEYRVANGLQPYKTSPALQNLAKDRAFEEISTGVSHTRPNGSSWTTIFGDYGISYTKIAENVGGGTQSMAGVPEVMLQQWKTSEGHNANLLGNCEYIGIGMSYYDGNCYWSQIFCSSSDASISNGAYITSKPESFVTTTTESPITITETQVTTTELPIETSIPDENYDINKDGKIDTIDLILLKRKLLEMHN